MASGELMKFSKTSNSEYFPAVLVSLGSIGIIVNVTVQCEKLFKLQQVQFGAQLDDVSECNMKTNSKPQLYLYFYFLLNEVLKSLDVHMSASEHFEFLWYPHTDNVVCLHTSRSEKPINNSKNWFKDYFIGYYLLEFLLWISTFFVSLVPIINKVYLKIASQRKEKVDLSYNIFNFDCLFQQHVIEAAIPV